jgi:hypothetical protein
MAGSFVRSRDIRMILPPAQARVKQAFTLAQEYGLDIGMSSWCETSKCAQVESWARPIICRDGVVREHLLT